MDYNVIVSDMTFGQEVEGYYLLRDAVIKLSANGKPFLSGSASDRSGSIDIKVWDYSGPVGPGDNGKVIKLRGKVSEFRGTPQLTAVKIRLATENDPYNLADIIPTAPIDPEATLLWIMDLVDSIEDPDYRAVAKTMLEASLEKFGRIPAAKSVHHSFLHGLLMHTADMLRAADFLAGLYRRIIDRSLLLAGTLLHDFLKQEEFNFSRLGLVTDYSLQGDLLGHLVMGARAVGETADQLGIPAEKSILLQHLILSHHGEPEFGAAVRPMCAEAELLSLIDKMDSRMEIYTESLQDVQPGTFSPRVFALEKKIYRHT